MIELPSLFPDQEAAWHALFEVYDRYPHHWTLVGGQAVFLHAIDRGAPPVRPTTDADAGLDVRLRPNVLREFTQVLVGLGFDLDGESGAGHHHRWSRDSATIDVMIPRFTGERLEARRGAKGGTTIAAPGLQQALEKSSVVQVQSGGRKGLINLTSFMGILIGKGAALRIPVDPDRDRHLLDALLLATCLRGTDVRGVEFKPAERAHLANLTGHLVAARGRGLIDQIDGGEIALRRLMGITQGWSPADPNDRH